MGINIRRANKDDADTVIALLNELAIFERSYPLPADICARLVEDAWGEKPLIEAWLAEVNDTPVGFCLTYDTYSCYLARPILFLEALFIKESYRGLGVGTSLFRYLIQKAKRRGYGRLDWTSPKQNTRAHIFYKKMGGQSVDECIFKLPLDNI